MEAEDFSYVQSEDDGFPTQSSVIQRRTEKLVCSTLSNADPDLVLGEYIPLTRSYILNALNEGLESNFSSLDASRPWLCYWMCHSLNLLGAPIETELISRVIRTLTMCQHPSGGFGGGFMQMPHTAPTFASIMCLVSLGSRDALKLIARGPLYRFLLSLKRPDGAFMVHQDGECDTRAMYTVLAVAATCNMLTPELIKGCALWIKRTQGFDGGAGGEPGNESHGGYAYCALASLVILGGEPTLDLGAFSRWLFARQMSIEGGFQGRTNKLVDSCYSFWQGACFALLRRLDPMMAFPNCDSKALVRYVLGACVHAAGGLRDKPGAHRDFYHTCYALSGVSVVAHNDTTSQGLRVALKATDPVFNVMEERLGLTRTFFSRLPSTHAELMTM